MRTPKQIAASRANGAKSKGPVTVQGKRNSSRNSTRHGMFADTLVLEKENSSQFHELLNELLDEHQPSTPTQTMLVETIVAARWRQQRIWGIQKTNVDIDIDSITTNPENPAMRAALALRTNDDSIRSHELLLRFEIALDRQISRTLLRLQQLQDRSARRKGEPIEPPVPHHSKNSERTQQPIERKQPANAAVANHADVPSASASRVPRTPVPEAPTAAESERDVQWPAKLPVPSALQTVDVRFNRGRQYNKDRDE